MTDDQKPREGEVLPGSDTPLNAEQVHALAQRHALLAKMQSDYEAGATVRGLADAYGLSKSRVGEIILQLGWTRSLLRRVSHERDRILRDGTVDAEKAKEGSALSSQLPGLADKLTGQGATGQAPDNMQGTGQSVVPIGRGRRPTERQAVNAQARAQAVIVSRHQRTLRAVAEFNETAVTKALALLKALQVLDEAGVRGILAECVDVLASSKDTGLVAKALVQLLRIGEQAETLKAIVASGTKAGGGGLADIIPAERQASGIKDEEGGSGAEDFVSILMARRGARLKGGGSAPPALPAA